MIVQQAVEKRISLLRMIVLSRMMAWHHESQVKRSWQERRASTLRESETVGQPKPHL